MDFSLSEEEIMIRDTARAFVEKELSHAPLLKPGATIASADYEGHWRKMVELGWQALVIPEKFGGLGMDCVSLSLIAGELGRGAVPSPFLGNLMGVWAMIRCASDAQNQQLLSKVAAGEARLALAALDGPDGVAAEKMAAKDLGAAFELTGVCPFVIDASGADWLIVAARGKNGARGLYLVEASAPGVEISVLPWRDVTRQVCELRLTGVAAACLRADIASDWDWISDRISLALAVEGAAGMRSLLERTVAYAKERYAFGRPIGANQAIKHTLAELLGRVECAEVASLYAALALSKETPDAGLYASVAKSYVSQHSPEAARISIQSHGAIGFTWEMPIHLYYKRALANALMFGDARHHRRRALELFRAEAA
ncbi:MAG: acyl-CoA dehydrogenase family protein [Hyphomonadaceae bacterium]